MMGISSPAHPSIESFWLVEKSEGFRREYLPEPRTERIRDHPFPSRLRRVRALSRPDYYGEVAFRVRPVVHEAVSAMNRQIEVVTRRVAENPRPCRPLLEKVSGRGFFA
jgi:hypothetical protein